MTDHMMNLRSLVERTPDADLLREMIGFAAQRLMELEVEDQAGAAYGEKNAERLAQHNGYRERICETRAAERVNDIGTPDVIRLESKLVRLMPGLTSLSEG